MIWSKNNPLPRFTGRGTTDIIQYKLIISEEPQDSLKNSDLWRNRRLTPADPFLEVRWLLEEVEDLEVGVTSRIVQDVSLL